MSKGLALVSVILALTATVSRAEGWLHYELTDEMRGEARQAAVLKSVSSANPSVSLSMHSFNKGQFEQSTVLVLDGDRISCADRLCQVPVRFANGQVHDESMAISEDGKTAIPTNGSAFSASVGLSDYVYVELILSKGGPTQFKYKIDEPAFPRVFSPNFDILGMELGGARRDLPGNFVKSDAAPALDCRSAKDVEGVIPKIKVSSVKLCFFNEMLYAVFIESKNKQETGSIADLLKKKLGPKDAESYMTTWPASDGRVMNPHTVRATFWPDPDSKVRGLYAIFDESISPLIPK
jgi:hypothetical protein